ncbi:MAG: hypothetical protein E6767_01065 [Dysgonomonas sp.]|nr:hypothetical protein [Dysgonomonas sp.]
MKLIICTLALLFLYNCNSGKESKDGQPAQNNDSIIGQIELGDTLTIVMDTVKIDEVYANEIKPHIDKWLKYYDLDINDFRHYTRRTLHIEAMKTDTTYPYYGTFQPEDDVYNPILFDYSPDKSKYVNHFASLYVGLEEDGKYYFRGSDDSQQLYLFDRKGKSKVMISFRGISQFADAIFWVDNDTFALVGYDSIDAPGMYLLEIYDLKKDICDKYILRKEYGKEESYGMVEMKSRGIIID